MVGANKSPFGQATNAQIKKQSSVKAPDLKRHRLETSIGYPVSLTEKHQMQPIYDSETLNTLRSVLDDVLNDPLFPRSKAVSTLELAEFVLNQAARGERNPNAIKLAVRLMVEGVSSQAA